MSLKEAYTLAHTAQCRLHIEASRPDRNLRFVVGHLMHYESLRLRIVEIEHDITHSRRHQAVQFDADNQVDHRLQHKPSNAQLGRKSPPPPAIYDEDSDEEDFPEDFLDDEDAGELSLTRFPSGSSRPPQPPPELDPDDPEDSDEDFDGPVSPEDVDQETLERCMQGESDELMATMYEGVRKCVCNGKNDAPSIERMWHLPPDQANSKQGVTRAVAQIRAEMMPQVVEPLTA